MNLKMANESAETCYLCNKYYIYIRQTVVLDRRYTLNSSLQRHNVGDEPYDHAKELHEMRAIFRNAVNFPIRF